MISFTKLANIIKDIIGKKSIIEPDSAEILINNRSLYNQTELKQTINSELLIVETINTKF